MKMSNRRLSPFNWGLVIALTGLMLLTTAAANDFEAVEARLATLVPDASAAIINETPVAGLLEVRLGGDVIYMTSDGQHLLQGRLIDLDTRADLTDAAKSEMRVEQLAALDPETFVSFGPDDAEHRVMVFTDPDCGYCRRLHEQVDGYIAQGIQINYLGFPRAGEGSATYDKLVSVWCAEDQHEAMDIAKTGGTLPKASCDNPVSDHYQLGQLMGVTGTPALMTFSGTLIPGYVPPEQLKSRLDQEAAAR
ncbi:MAG TPA: DsbC family protein [Wenzhouxiangella sp.]